VLCERALSDARQVVIEKYACTFQTNITRCLTRIAAAFPLQPMGCYPYVGSGDAYWPLPLRKVEGAAQVGPTSKAM